MAIWRSYQPEPESLLKLRFPSLLSCSHPVSVSLFILFCFYVGKFDLWTYPHLNLSSLYLHLSTSLPFTSTQPQPHCYTHTHIQTLWKPRQTARVAWPSTRSSIPQAQSIHIPPTVDYIRHTIRQVHTTSITQATTPRRA